MDTERGGLESILAGNDEGAKGCCFSVAMSADGIAVLSSDGCAAAPDGTRLPVSDYSYAELHQAAPQLTPVSQAIELARTCQGKIAITVHDQTMLRQLRMTLRYADCLDDTIIIGLGLVCIEFTMTAGILSRWFHTNYGTVTGIVFAMTGVGGVVWNIIGQFVLGPELAGWHTLYMIFGVAIAIGTVPFIAIFVKRTPQECGTLPYGMPLDAAAQQAELEAAGEKAAEEPGFRAKEVLKMPFFWTLLLGAGLLNTITTMSQLFATYVQFLGHDGWGGEALVGLLLLSGTLEAFASAGQGGGKVLIGFIESRSIVVAQLIGYAGGVIGLLMMWWLPQMFGEAGIWPMFCGGLFYGLAYACSTAMLPFLVREVFGGRDFDKIYSWMIMVFNGIGALGATGWALVAEGFGWHGFFIGGLIVLTITFGLLLYTWKAGDKARRKAWFKTDEQLAAEAAALEAAEAAAKA